MNVIKVIKWEIEAEPIKPSAYFQTRLQRLKAFNLRSSASGMALLINAVFEEALDHHSHLKVWVDAPLQSDELVGKADYLVAPNRAWLDNPLMCAAIAGRDDFERGMSQCLLAMNVCRWNAEQQGRKMDVYGIVSNGELWEFWKLTNDGKVYRTLPYALGSIERLLGRLNYLLTLCEENLAQFAEAA